MNEQGYEQGDFRVPHRDETGPDTPPDLDDDITDEIPIQERG